MPSDHDPIVPPNARGRLALSVVWGLAWSASAWIGLSKGLGGLVSGTNRQRWCNESGSVVFDETFTGLKATWFNLNELFLGISLLTVALLGARLIYLGDYRNLPPRQHRSLLIAVITALVGGFVLVLPRILYDLGIELI